MNKKEQIEYDVADLSYAEHPSRKLAIMVMDKIQGELQATIKGDLWYDNEDRLTSVIDEVRNEIYMELVK